METMTATKDLKGVLLAGRLLFLAMEFTNDLELSRLIMENERWCKLQGVKKEGDGWVQISCTELPTSTQLLSDCKKRFKELEGKGNLDYRSYRNGYLDSFSKNVVSKKI